jgi:uncharacterized membrane protein YcaP (DUF421 family)
MQLLYNYILTPIAVFIVGYILLRLLGKKAVGEMSSFDLLVVLVLGTAISEPIVTKNLGIASFYSVVLVATYIVFAKLSLNNRLKRWLHSKPTILIKDGEIDKKGLEKVHLTVDEILAELRLKGYTKTTDVELAVMEEMGKVSILPKADARPLQPSDLQITPQPTTIPVPLIIDGDIIHANLNYLGKDMDWLKQQIKTFGVVDEELDPIVLATYNELKNSVDVRLTNQTKNEFKLGSNKGNGQGK